MTPEITLRDVVDADIPIFLDHQNDPEAAYMAAFTPRDPEAFREHWKKIRDDPAVIQMTIIHEGEVVGHVAAFNRLGAREVAYWIGREHWGKGIATAALAELLREEAKRPIFARVATDNVGSRRVLEKCGFTPCGQERMYADARGEEITELIMKLD